MKRSVLLIALLAALVAALPASAGGDEAEQKAEALLKQADARVASLRDFKANLKARTQFPLLGSMNLTGHVYFKRPNRLKVEIDRMPMVLQKLKQQMQVQPPYHNRKSYVPRFLRAEDLDGRPCDVIAFQARDSSTKLQTTTIWLERKTGTVPRTILDYADGSRCTMNTIYARVQNFWLPRSSDIEMSMPAMKLVAEVVYTNYVLNSNLPDSIFDKH